MEEVNPCMKIEVSNLMGLESLSVEPGALCVVSGANGQGKTSFLEAVRCVATEGHDASLLRRGEKSGFARLTLKDGTVLQKTIYPEKSVFEARHPVLGKISRARAFVDSLVDELGRDPFALIACPPAKRAEMLADLLSVEVTKAELDEAAPGFAVPPKVAGLERIEAIRKAAYDERTGVNRTAKDKRATAAQLRETLPPADAAAPDLAALHERRAAAEARLAAAERDAIRTKAAALEGIRSNAQSEIDAVRADAAERIRAIESERDAAVERIKARGQELAEGARGTTEAELRRVADEVRPQLEALAAEIATAEAAEREHTRAEKTREILAAAERDAAAAEMQAKALTATLERLDALRAAKLATLPVKGLEIREGLVYLDGLPFDRVNTARQLEIALEVAALRAKDVPLLVSDHGEALDDANWSALEAKAKALGMNVIVARRTEGPLSVQGSAVEEAA